MKPALKYGQAVRDRNQGRAAPVDVFIAAVAAVRAGCRLAAYRREVTAAGVTIIRKVPADS